MRLYDNGEARQADKFGPKAECRLRRRVAPAALLASLGRVVPATDQPADLLPSTFG